MTGSNTQHNPLTTCGMAAEATGRLGLQDWLFIIGLTLIALVMNVSRPMTVDDPPYLVHAIQMAENPLKPYDFSYIYTEWPEQGLALPSPPVVAVWNAVCIKIFGVSELALQLWMTPYFLLLAWSMFRLAKPWAGPWTALGVGTVLAGPIILPGLKLMIDLPAAALAATSICLLRDYLEDRAGRWALFVAGIACALAPLAKYTGFSAVAAAVAMAWLYRKPLVGFAMAGGAIGLFMAWEAYVYGTQGYSHLLYQLDPQVKSKDLPFMIKGALVILSNGTPLLLACVACCMGLRRPVWITLAAAGLASQWMLVFMQVPLWVYMTQSALVLAGLAWLATRLLLKPGQADRHGDTLETQPTGPVPLPEESRRLETTADRFVVAWLAIEIVLMLVITPFLAYRRVVGVVLAMGLLAARAGARSGAKPDPLAGPVLVAASLLTSLLFFHADRTWAQATPTGLAQAQAFVEQARADGNHTGRLYVLGRWTVPWYGPRMGMEELVLDQTRLQPGDMALIATAGMYMPAFSMEPGAFEPVRKFNPIGNFPLDPSRTYGTAAGLTHGTDVGVEFSLVRALKPTIIRARPDPDYFKKSMLKRTIPPSPLTSWALLETALAEPDPFANPYAQKLIGWGDPFILRALEHPASKARLWVLTLLEQNPGAMSEQVRAGVEKRRDDPQENPLVRQAAGMLTR